MQLHRFILLKDFQTQLNSRARNSKSRCHNDNNRNGDDDNDNDNNTILIRLQADLGYKRRPQTSTQKINLINTDFKCIILGHKPRAIFGLDGNNNNISK